MAEVYITGVAGMLGREVANLFMKSGYSVGGSDVAFAPTYGNRHKDLIQELDFYEWEDPALIRSIPSDTKYLIHCYDSDRPASPDFHINGTNNIMGLAMEFESKLRVVNCSTYEAGFPTEHGHAKYVAEGAASLANAASLRFSHIYGSEQRGGVLAKWQKEYAEKRLVTIHGDGTQKRDFLHVSDAAYAVYLAAHYGYWLLGRSVDVCTGVQTSINSLAAACGFPVAYRDDVVDPIQEAPQNNDEMYRVVGWSPRVPLDRGLKGMGLVERGRHR